MSSPAVRLLMREVRKSFGATQALRGVSLEVRAGEAHALIGENGAGKSTLMKVLSGVHTPDSGSIELDGVPFEPRNPLHSWRSGIAMIYQELTLAPHLTVAENILMGHEPATLGLLHWKQLREKARNALAELDHASLNLDRRVLELSIAEQQIVEIARALIVQPKVLLMDEPTSSLTQKDVDRLFVAIRRLVDRGVSVVYISHFLEESRRICERFTVIRDGETVATGPMAGTSPSTLVHHMVGREISDVYPRSPRTPGVPLLQLNNLAGQRKPTSASLQLRAGEILGIAGLIGAGRTETLRTCFGLDPLESGSIQVGGVAASHRTPGGSLRAGIGLVSENRKEEGLMLNRSLADNMTLTRLGVFGRCGWINGRAQQAATVRWMDRLRVRARHPAQPIGELSGGNQQKIALARLLHHEASIFLLDEPTRGIDVGSKVEIYRLMDELACSGKAVIFVSSYLPELLGVCDSIGVMCRGVLTEVRPVKAWTEHSIMEAAIGQPLSSPDQPTPAREAT